MTNPRNEDFIDGGEDQTNNQDFEDSTSSSAVEAASGVGSGGGGSSGVSGSGIELTERLTNILVDEGDGDLLLQLNDREDRVLQWLQALDMQVMGACRADERLKPLLKHNVSTGAVEDNLLAHLSQHFEPSEVGLLARCFCIPLVSIRVGKVHQRGAQLCPTDRRGNLNLTLLPTSDLRLSFIGDDGYSERLFTLRNKSQCSLVAVEDIQADSSGRSFLVKTPDGKALYFWCSEKSKLLGIELLTKMKDLLKRKPSIAEFTGISEARLGCFAAHLRTYLVGSTGSNTHTSSAELRTITAESTHEPSGISQNVQPSPDSSKCSISSSYKEGTPMSLYSVRTAAREKVKWPHSNVSAVDSLSNASPVTSDAAISVNEKPRDVENCPFSPTSFLESLGKFTAPPALGTHVSNITTPIFSPYYCWCPPGSSALQYPAAPPYLPTSLINSTSLPPLSSLLPPERSNLLASTPPMDLPPMDFPALLPDPLVRFPMPKSQQIPIFTPLMCDPIVHVPVIDVCSSGQGYLVSAPPTTISPLHPKHLNSDMEKGARETLRLLLSSSGQTTPHMMGAFPGVDVLGSGSRGLYSGARDVGAIANSIAAMGLVPLSGITLGSGLSRCDSSNNLPQESTSGPDKKGTMSWDSGEENMDL